MHYLSIHMTQIRVRRPACMYVHAIYYMLLQYIDKVGEWFDKENSLE